MKFTFFLKKNKSNSTKTSKNAGINFPGKEEEARPLIILMAIPFLLSNIIVFYLASSPKSEDKPFPLAHLKDYQEFITPLKLKTPFQILKKIQLQSPTGKSFPNIYFLGEQGQEQTSFLNTEEEPIKLFTLFVPSKVIPQLMRFSHLLAMPHGTPVKKPAPRRRSPYEINY